MNAPDRHSLIDADPGRLWSLWDIMKKVNVAEWLELGMSAGASRTQLIMDKHDFGPPPERISEKIRHLSIPTYKHIEKECVDLGLISALATTRRIIDVLERSDFDHSKLLTLEQELHGRLSDEFMERACFALSASETEIFLNWRKGWEEIIDRFSDSSSDIEEARKCFALSRYAGAVFHSLQIVEVGLIELGRVFRATDHQTGWNATIKQINAILNTKYPDRTPFQQEQSKFLEQIIGTIEILKGAWRNKVSHAQDKLVLLRTDFTPDIAEEILFATRSFMRRLATDAPTAPDPDA